MGVASLVLLESIAGMSIQWRCRTPEIVTKLKRIETREFSPLPPDSPLRKPLIAGRRGKKSKAQRKAVK